MSICCLCLATLWSLSVTPTSCFFSPFSAEMLDLEQGQDLSEAPDDSVCWAQWLWVRPEVALSVGFQALLMVWSGLPF